MMKKTHCALRRAILVFLSAMFIFSSALTALPARGAVIDKTEKSYEIAVVFDNSGSMYTKWTPGGYVGVDSWYRAKYAMEIFASMLDYEKDSMTIFPMWWVATDGTTPAPSEAISSYIEPRRTQPNGTLIDAPAVDPVPIKSKEDIDKISNLFTIESSGTPFEAVEEAYAFLEKSDADNKWLVVLADGAFDIAKRKDNEITITAATAGKNMLEMASGSDINIQYLGFADVSPDDKQYFQTNESAGFYSTILSGEANASEDGLRDALVQACNLIFERDELDSKYIKDNRTVTFDVSMKSVVVFVQGNGCNITSLEGPNGVVKATQDSGQRTYCDDKYSHGGTYIEGKKVELPPEDGMTGRVVTFGACASGEYTLKGEGIESVQVFYVPDVDIKFELVDAEDKTVADLNGQILATDYMLNYAIVDNITGEDVTDSEIIDVSELTAEVNGQTVENGGEITLEPETQYFVKISGKYLGDYTITTENDPDAFTIDVWAPKKLSDLQIKVDVEQEHAWYTTYSHEDWKPIRVTYSIDGQPLTDEQMAQTTLAIDLGSDAVYHTELLPGQSAYLIHLGTNEAGEYTEPPCNIYMPKVTGTAMDKYGRELTDDTRTYFEIQPYSMIWRWLFWVLLAALLIFLFLLFMGQKVLPKNIILDGGQIELVDGTVLEQNFIDFKYSKKSRTLSVKTSNTVDPDYQMGACYTLKPESSRWVRSSDRRVTIVGISKCALDSHMVQNLTYVKVNGHWMKETQADGYTDGSPVPKIEHSVRNPRFDFDRNGAVMWCTTRFK